VVLPVLSRCALGSFRTNDPRIRDFQQSGPVSRQVVRHSSTLFGVSPELDGIIWHWELLPISEAMRYWQRKPATRRSCTSRFVDKAWSRNNIDVKAFWPQPTIASVRVGCVIMNSEHYRSHAAACLKLAQSVTDEGDKMLLIQMAETWRHLAERIEARRVAQIARSGTALRTR
jgi:hypothetical protein